MVFLVVKVTVCSRKKNWSDRLKEKRKFYKLANENIDIFYFLVET